MSLAEVLEETKKQLSDLEKEENKEEEIKTEEEKEEKKEEVKEEVKEPPKEEAKEEVKAEEQPKKTNADYARERRERISEAQRLRDELAAANARIVELTRPVGQTKQVEDPEPNKDDSPVEWADWRARQAEKKADAAAEIAMKASETLQKEERRRQGENLVQQAQNELIGYENEFKKNHTDYEDVKKFYVNSLAYGIKVLNPKITNEALAKAVNNQILLTASQYYNDGYANPIEAIYENVKNMGYQPPREEAKEEKKPDLSKVAKNRERNAGMAASAGGTGKGELTKRYAATEMTAYEWAKLPVAERERLMREG